ncbi:MAG: type IX secretion system membrane protein PorP/SprF [Lewinella sp.]|nr:type IX secretion system membrane protein PorP/SprF [Lewinella sp.]
MLRYLILILFPLASINAQDAYLQHFYGNESSFNPAFTGQQGALRLGISYRTQWGATTAPAYLAQKVVLEESLPCLFFDYGLFARRDEEGAGKLTTSEFGGSIAIAVPWEPRFLNRTSSLNFRFGASLAFGQRSVDFDALNFLDQIDPFFGLVNADNNPNSTGFVAPLGAGISPRYSTGSLGISLKGGINATSKRPLSFDVGVAIHNPGFFTGPDSRQSASLLGLDNTLGRRMVYTGRADWVVARVNRRTWSVKPSAVYQSQKGLSYLETGVGISWNQAVTVGGYYHSARPNSVGRNVGWSSAQLELGGRLPGTQTRFDLGFSYAFQHGFLKNYVRPPLEVSAVFSFGRSTTCAVLGYDSESWMSKSNATACPNFVKAKSKIYDNIWYKADRMSGKY